MTSRANNMRSAEHNDPFETICNELSHQLETVCGQKIRRGETVYIAGHFSCVIRKGHVQTIFGVAETVKMDFRLAEGFPDQEGEDS